MSEQHDKLRPHPSSFADTMIDLAIDKEEGIHRAYERYNAGKARKKLQRLVNQKFAGSVDILFNMTDTNHDGEMDFEEFSAILKRQRLEQFFGRKEQRDIFKAMDTNHTDKVNMTKLVEFLKGESEGFPTVVKQPLALDTPDAEALRIHAKESIYLANKNVSVGSDMNFTTSAAQRTAAQELKKRAEKSKEGIVRKIVEKRRLEKNEDGTGFTAKYVLNAFKQCDTDMSGKLSRKELEFTFGPKWLNLGVSKEDMDDFIEVADVDKDGEISYSEFIKAMHIHDLEPSYNPVMEARERSLKLLKGRVNEPFKYEAELNKMKQTAHEAQQASLALHTAAEEEKRTRRLTTMNPSPADTTATLPAAWNSCTKPVPRLPAPGSDKNPGNDGRAVVDAEELFKDMERIDAVVRDTCGKTMTGQSEHHAYDNSRIGVGSSGVNPNSGLYADPSERFSTTSLDYHAPLRYAPNQPVTRPGARCDSVRV
jgi:Ca2+-binding EF-hand superfamily protein